MEGSSISWFDSLVLGIIQGLTEFFPVSSDGHLVLGQYFLNFKNNNLVFDVMLHFGTLAALLVVFHRDIRNLLVLTWSDLKVFVRSPSLDFFTQSGGERRAMLYVWTITLITGLLGLLLEKKIEATFNSIQAAGWGFIITSVALFIGSAKSQGGKKVFQLGWWFPLLLGVAQGAALLPGVSRSGMTIACALLAGLNRTEAGRFSFYSSIPIIFLAVLYESRKVPSHFQGDLLPIGFGVVISFIVGLFALKGLLFLLRHLSLYPFAVYTGLVGLITLYFVLGAV